MPIFSGASEERVLSEFVNQGLIDSSVLDIALPDGRPLEYEGSLWDYKRKFPNTTGKFIDGADDPSDTAVCELVKDVVAFYNSFGGYLIGGIAEGSADPIFGCKNSDLFAFSVEKLNERVFGYTKNHIKCKLRKFEIQSSGRNLCLAVLYVPRRAPHVAVVQMAKGAPEEGGKSVFIKGDIFARLDDRCVPARQDSRVLPFVCSPRLTAPGAENGLRFLENNLPIRDPNLLRFVGRSQYLENLWGWMVERNSPLKVLTALGGTGKTSIAFEFCERIIQNSPAWLEKVVWLSAKKQTFSAVQGKKYSASRVDFFDIASFFAALALELGAVQQEVDEADGDIDDLIDLCYDSITSIPALIVVDDIDTLSLEDQGELFSRIQALSGRVFENGNRFLVTSRLEFGGSSQRIKVEGFPPKEFAEYVDVLCEETRLSVPNGMVDQLRKASLGSPVFAASIFRLASFGTPMHKAIKDWKGRAGEEVRRFAFEKEIDQLSDAERRTLFALVTLGETTQAELAQILEIDQQQLLQHLSKIREFHLFATTDAIASGSKLTVPAPILLMSGVIRSRVPDPTRIEKECARARSTSPKVNDRIGQAIGEIIALWKENEFDDALIVADHAARANAKSSDLPCMLGRCYLMVSPQKPREADKAFSTASQRGCTRLELAPMWIEAKYLIEDWVGISELAGKWPKSDMRGQTALMICLAEARLGMVAAAKNDHGKAVVRFRNSMFSAQNTIRDGRADDSLPDLREAARDSARRLVALVDTGAVRPGDRLEVFNAVSDAFDCHISEANMMLLGAVSLAQWASDVFQRRPADVQAIGILNSKLRKLDDIVTHISNEDFNRPELVASLSKNTIACRLIIGNSAQVDSRHDEFIREREGDGPRIFPYRLIQSSPVRSTTISSG